MPIRSARPPRRSPGRLSLLIAPALVLVLSLVASDSAWAEGGQSIAGATPVAYGQQEFGNTTGGAAEAIDFSEGCNGGYDDSATRSFWSLPVVAADVVTIDWEVQTSLTCLQVYPVGTTDFTLDKRTNCCSDATAPVLNESPAGNLKQESRFTATVSGAMPLIVRSFSGYGGPYNFTAYVTHTVRLSIPRHATIRHTGVLPVAVHNPEGGPVSDSALQVSVQIKGRGPWLTVGKASVLNSVATVHLTIPVRLHRHTVSLRAIAQGSNYATATTVSQHMRIR